MKYHDLDITDEEASQHWHDHRPPDAPENFTPDLAQFLKGLSPEVSWEETTQRAEATAKALERATDPRYPFLASPNDDETDKKGAILLPPELHSAMEDAFRESPWNNGMAGDTQNIRLVVYQRLLDMWRWLRLVPEVYDPKHSEFFWAKTRCVLAGAGYENHRALASRLCDLDSECDLDPAEDHRAWLEKLDTAHALCGWPCTLGTIYWHSLRPVIREYSRTHAEGEIWQADWLKVIVVLHCLKHLRHTPTGILCYYDGINHRKFTRATTEAVSKAMRADLAQWLDIPMGKKNNQTLAYTFYVQFCNEVKPAQLVQRIPMESLPPSVIHGPWVMFDRTFETTGFIQHGLKFSGVWVADGGTVREYDGDDEDITLHEWPHDQTPTKESVNARRAVENIIPTTYDVAWPSDVILKAWPNIITHVFHGEMLEGYKAIIDALFVADQLRSYHPLLRCEFPFILVQPYSTQIAETTNQGKSVLSLMLARAFAPGAELMNAGNSDSAPAQRSIAHPIHLSGTVALDEFIPPNRTSHILSNDRLQSLCTGGNIADGQVMSNDSKLYLQHPLVACNKANSFPPDMVNRTIYIWLDELTNDQLNGGSVLADIRSGKYSMAIRLGAHAIIDQFDLAEKVNTAKPTRTRTGLRYEMHEFIAREIYRIKNPKGDVSAVETAARTMREIAGLHTEDADSTGLLAAQDAGRQIRFSVSALFDDIAPEEVVLMRQWMNDACSGHGRWYSGTDILRARASLRGWEDHPLTYTFRALTGDTTPVSDRFVRNAFVTGLKEYVQDGAFRPLPGGLGLAGWAIERRDRKKTNAPDQYGFRIYNQIEEALKGDKGNDE